jgi:carbon monoxide dehydrogenase subunit G
MELAGQRRLPVDRDTAWKALNDPEVLKASIPGCESIEKVSDDDFSVTVATVLGPVRAKFRGRLRLENVLAPERYTLRFEGEGGAAGFAKGSADVTLTAKDGATILDYKVNAQVAGRIAQVGSRLIDSAAMKLADEFFAAFEKTLSGTISVERKIVPDTISVRNTPIQVVFIALILVALVASVAFTLR